MYCLSSLTCGVCVCVRACVRACVLCVCVCMCVCAAHIEDMIEVIFQYIAMLRREGPKEWIFKECSVSFPLYSKCVCVCIVLVLPLHLFDVQWLDTIYSYSVCVSTCHNWVGMFHFIHVLFARL